MLMNGWSFDYNMYGTYFFFLAIWKVRRQYSENWGSLETYACECYIEKKYTKSWNDVMFTVFILVERKLKK